ncbi:DNA alkylation repair protein [Parenemella sanctibonifatiensis]|nr:DNA alkylation repair protein [Parenemella sanctibonifatiensis]
MTDPGSPAEVIAQLEALANPEHKASTAKRIPEELVIGVRMREVFDLAKRARDLPLADVRTLLRHELYEPRLVAVCILDFRARLKRISEDERRGLYELYLAEHDHIDSWDLVDRAAPRVIGGYVVGKDPEPLYALAQHPSTWRRRTAITAAFTLIRAGELDAPVRLIDLLLDDPEHFVQTSVGVALRELNRASPKRCEEFLAGNRDRLSSTTKRLMRDSRRSS